MPEKEDTFKSLNPMLKWWFFLVIAFNLLWWFLIENFPELYLLGLFFIFPVFCLAWIIISRLLRSRHKWEVMIFLVSSLTLFLYTLFPTISLLLFTLTGYVFLGVSIYLKHFHTSRKQRMLEENKKVILRNEFKIAMKNKNFLNHHNYYSSDDAQRQYKKLLLKKSILSSIYTSAWISGGIFLLSLSEWLKSTQAFKGSLAICLTIFIVWGWFAVWKAIFRHYTKTIWKKIQIYQFSTLWDRFVEIRNKILRY